MRCKRHEKNMRCQNVVIFIISIFINNLTLFQYISFLFINFLAGP